MRRLAVTLTTTAFFLLLLPAAAWAAEAAAPDKPDGTDHTLTTIFVVAAGIPLVLALLTLIDIAVGKHRRDH